MSRLNSTANRWSGWATWPSRFTLGVVLLMPMLAVGREVLRTNPDSAEGLVVEVRGFFKSAVTFVAPSPPLVEGTAALSRVIADARAQLSPEDGARLPPVEPLPPLGAATSQVARLSGRMVWRDWLEFTAAWQVASSVTSSGSISPGAFLTGGSGGAAAKRRLVDFHPLLASPGTLRLEHSVDLLALKVMSRRVDVTVGRQVLSWGAGRLWNPTDVVSPFPPTAIDKEVRRGIDAVRLSMPFSETAQLDVLWLPQPVAADMGGVARVQANVRGVDGSLSAGKYARDVVLGADVSGEVGAVGVHGEAAWTLAVAESPGAAEHFLRAVAGADWRLGEKLLLTAEYHFNGAGVPRPEDYLAQLASARARRGEVFGAGRHFLGVVAAWQPSEVLSVQGVLLVNLLDPSAMMVPALEYAMEQSVLIRVGAFLPIGRWPRTSGFSTLTAEDVLRGAPSFVEATRTLGLTSEYGAGSFGGFIQVGLYLP